MTEVNESLYGHRPTWAEIDLDALAANFHLVRERVGADVKIMSVVKANAYGHGAARCARRLEQEGSDWFGVILPEEGIELREAGITKPILCLQGFWSGQEQALLKYNLTPVVYRVDIIEALDRAAGDAGVVADVHVKIDTGMGRLGIRYDSINDFIDAILGFKNIRVDGLMTHFAAADEQQFDGFTFEQITKFRMAVAAFQEKGFQPTHTDLANSAGIVGHTASHKNMVRPGGVLYGLWRDVLPYQMSPIPFRSVMSLYSRILLLKKVPTGETLGYGRTFKTSRDSLIATVPIGYHDGYMRGLSNRGRVIVKGKYAPVVGRVSMDATMIDVTDIGGVRIDDAVTLLGNENSLSITAEEIAQHVGTLSYEVTCGISERVPRIYKQVLSSEF
jgi:alanine racemase